MASKPPDAFLSYTRWDDRRDGGKISRFRLELVAEVRTVTGEAFEIFQDIDDIDVGERWSDKLDQVLDVARFFVPILTPNYFNSKACRDELAKFLKAERAKGRADLVLPIYYIECDVLEDAELRASDPLATEIHKRQHHDWRKLRHSSFSTKAVKIELHALARAIGKARRRPMPASIPERPAEPTPTSTAKPDEDRWERYRAQERARADEARSRGAEKLRQGEESTPANVAPAAKHARREAEEQAAARPQPDEKPPTRAEAPLEPGRMFRDKDAEWCPELVVIPPGEFMMGSSEGERAWAIKQGATRERIDREKPQHLVRIAYPLAVGRYPVTFDEYGYFARKTGRAQPGDRGWGRGRRPVINVGWEDAKAFAAWLSVRTGQSYRLLSEAEWEYACRAGTTTRYWWGEEITPKNANYGLNVGKTSEVGRYPANPFGVHDMHGNVWEWVEDCWNGSYEGEGRPDDGSAWTSGDCGRRVLRGGSWDYLPARLRSALRNWSNTGDGSNDVGFRVARTLSRSESVTS